MTGPPLPLSLHSFLVHLFVIVETIVVLCIFVARFMLFLSVATLLSLK